MMKFALEGGADLENKSRGGKLGQGSFLGWRMFIACVKMTDWLTFIL